nr:protein timeless homolog [Lytechinus pictus]
MAVDVLNPVNMNCELLATCNALGYLEGQIYQKEPDCLETIKDLIRFLKREDETCSIRRQLGHAQILQNDLIPLTKQFSKEEELFETTIRLLVNLTQPAELCFQNVPDDKTFRNYFLEVLSHLQAYKQAFACEEFMAVMARKLKKMLDMEWESRREDHTLLMERILLLVRNVLHIPADPNAEKRTDDDASVHDQVLWALNVSGIDKLILYIASAEGEQQWCMHAIEIISHMLREQSPESIAKAGRVQHASERLKEEKELEKIRQREMLEKKARLLKASGRHSRFGGSFYMTNFKSISDRDLIYHRPLQQAKTMTFESTKNATKKPKNKLPLQDGTINRRSTLSIRLFLKDFCMLFLDNCYNPLMNAVKDHILHRRAQENDESYYFWAMQFFMQFSRLYKFRVDVISETFSVQSFHYVNTQLIKYLDMMTTDKKEATAWSKRLHLALKAYRELLATLNEMVGPHSSPELKESADAIQSNVFYVLEYREVFITLLKKFNEVTCTRTYLKDLIESVHIFMKMLEKYGKGKKTLIVQKKLKKKSKRRKRRQGQRPEENQANEEQNQLTQVWDDTLAMELSSMLQGREDIPDDVVPFDAASEMPVEEQRADAMVRIQQSLRSGRAGEGLALFRAAREVWPDGDVFGAADIEPEDEFMALREIHFTNLNVQTQAEPDVEEQEIEEEDEEDEMAMEEHSSRGEEEFNFKLYVNKFTHPDVLRNYIKLLMSFRGNQEFTNHCIVKLLHRVSLEVDKMELLFQISLFRIFHKILQDPLAKTDQFKEMTKFAQFVVGRFFKALPTKPKLVVELLFWKDARSIYEIQEGYGAEQPKKGKSSFWNEEEEAELAGLYEQYRDVDGGERDVVDLIMENLINDTRSRRQIIAQLIRQELIESAKMLRKPKVLKSAWREELELELRTLFDQYKDSNDIVGNIIQNMSEPKSKQAVAKKILDLGLVQDRSQLYKKRARKADGGGTKRRRRRRRHGDDDEDVPEEDDVYAEGLQDFPDEDLLPTTDDSSSDDDKEESEEEGEEDDEEVPLEDIITKLQRKGLTEQIRWIQEGLRRTAEDREESGDNQAIPIVPLSEESGTAMRNKSFQKFLKKIGLSEPRSHEEVYWRMPGDLSASTLREMADSIEPKEGVDVLPAESKSSKKSNARYQMLKQMALSKRQEKEGKQSVRQKRREARQSTQEPENEKSLADLYDADTDVSGEEEEEETGKAAGGQRSRIKRSLPSDSSDDSDDEKLSSFMSQHRGDTLPQEKPAKRSKLQSSDDSDDEQLSSLMNNHRREDSSPQELAAEPSRLMSSDDEMDKRSSMPKKSNKLKKQARLVSSDDDSDEDRLEIDEGVSSPRKASPVSKMAKRSRMVVSDDSEEEEEKSEDEIEEELDDTQSEIFDLIAKPPKKSLKKQTPFDFSDEEDTGKMESEPVAMQAEELTSHDQSLHLRLSSDSPSDADVTMKDDATTEDDDPGDVVGADDAEDNARNFEKDTTNNAANDNDENNLDNKESDVEEMIEDEGEWEEILDDDSDFDMTSSNQPAASSASSAPAVEASSDSDSDDDVPLRKVAKRNAISSDSEDE